uniref:Uncharacterized protein n=1 Tax=Chenopodium quinoa TaxID=63459 RepID=A0A803N1S0_CHEQI
MVLRFTVFKDGAAFYLPRHVAVIGVSNARMVNKICLVVLILIMSTLNLSSQECLLYQHMQPRGQFSRLMSLCYKEATEEAESSKRSQFQQGFKFGGPEIPGIYTGMYKISEFSVRVLPLYCIYSINVDEEDGEDLYNVDLLKGRSSNLSTDPTSVGQGIVKAKSERSSLEMKNFEMISRRYKFNFLGKYCIGVFLYSAFLISLYIHGNVNNHVGRGFKASEGYRPYECCSILDVKSEPIKQDEL